VDDAGPVSSVTLAGLDLASWSAAEFLDTPLDGDLTLRALVCRLGAGKWQWSISSLDGERGELISIGIKKSADAARQMAIIEIVKCLENALASPQFSKICA
jgi:hypothetical protein